VVAEAQPDAAPRRALRVLVIDDNEDAADGLGRLVQLWGYDARVAYGGADGLEVARAYRPDCLLLDIDMPVVDGYSVARQIRREPGLEGVKIVAVTAYSDGYHTERARREGFDYHLVKPADPAEIQGLLQMLEQVIALAGKTEELARQNVALAGETKELLKEVRQDIREVKEEVKELKEELKEVRDELKDQRDGGEWRSP
jgi:CheY-like chemotaxis protein